MWIDIYYCHRAGHCTYIEYIRCNSHSKCKSKSVWAEFTLITMHYGATTVTPNK